MTLQSSAHAFYIAGNLRIHQAQDSNPRIAVEQRRQWLDEAYEFHVKSLKLSRMTFGTGHHRVADACMRLAWHLDQRGKLDEAMYVANQSRCLFLSFF